MKGGDKNKTKILHDSIWIQQMYCQLLGKKVRPDSEKEEVAFALREPAVWIYTGILQIYSDQQIFWNNYCIQDTSDYHTCCFSHFSRD
jgi:hypothetical protein